MFRFLKKVLKKPETKKDSSSDSNRGGKEKKLSLAQSILIIGGLFYLLLSMSYGSIYAAFYLEKSYEEEISYLKQSIDFTENKEMENAKEKTEESFNSYVTDQRLSSAHAHLNLFGLVAIGLAGIVEKIKLKEKWKTAGAIGLIVGSIILPVGLLVQIAMKILGMIISAVGGSLIMISVFIYLWGAIKMVKHHSAK